MSTAQINLEKKRHSLAHILAYAVKRLYPEVKIGIGPVTDTGFYYEFDSPHKFTQEDLTEIEGEMKKIISEDLYFVNIIIPKEQAMQTLLQLGETYKAELLEKIPDQEVSFYKTGEDFIDLCRGPHVKSTGELANFKLIRIRESHWMNDQTRPVMQKIEGIAFDSKNKLDRYLVNISRIEEVNSIEIGHKLGFFKVLKNLSSSPLYESKGIIVYESINDYIRKQLLLENFNLIQEPLLRETKTNELENFSKFLKHRKFLLEGTNMQIRWLNIEFLIEQLKEKNFDGKLASVSRIYNNSQLKKDIRHLSDFQESTSATSVVLTDFAQAKTQIEEQLKLIGKVLRSFGFNQFKTVLQVPDYQDLTKYLYEEKSWDKSINIFKELITELKLPSKVKEGGAAFFGPRLGVVVKDKFLREWQLANIVIDNTLPQKLGISPDKEAILIHTNMIESIEKLMDLLIEHTEGHFPLWLAPVQVKIIPMASNIFHKALSVERELRGEGFRVKSDLSNLNPDEKISKALESVYPYIIIIGEKELENDAISIKADNGDDLGLMRMNEFVQKLKTELQEEQGF